MTPHQSEKPLTQTSVTGTCWGDALDRRLKRAHALLDRLTAFTTTWYTRYGAGAAYPWYAQEAYELAHACLERPHREDFHARIHEAEDFLTVVEDQYGMAETS